MRFRLLRAAGLFALVALAVFNVQAADERPEWWRADKDVSQALWKPEASITALVKDVEKAAPASGQQALFKLAVLARAGIGKETIDTAGELRKLCPDLNGSEVSAIYYDACDHFHRWDLAQAIVDSFAEQAQDIDLTNRLIKHLQESGKTFEEIDAWLAAKPKGQNNFWIKERLRFNLANGHGAALETELEAAVRANPGDVAGAIAFLDTLVAAGHDPDNTPNVAWIAETVTPKLAAEASEMANDFQRLTDYKSAAALYRQAAATELTKDEVERVSRMTQVALTESAVRANFAVRTREQLAECLLKTGQPDEAQKSMQEANEIRERNKLPSNALLAGQVQAASGAHVVEDQIKAAEPKSEKDLEYWLDRATYYRGRNQAADEEAALKKGLAIAKPELEPERAFKRATGARVSLLRLYVNFLERQQRGDEAVALLRKELADSPANSESARQAAHALVFEFANRLSPDDPVLWTWLENRPRWDYAEERLLWDVLKQAKNPDQYFDRAEKLALNVDPTRAQALGWIENRMGFAKRSLPLLEYAVKNAADDDFRQKATFALFESYLDTGDWKHAEEVFPTAAMRLTSREVPQWYGRIAILAAKAGDKDDALRMWKRVANYDLTTSEPVQELARAGLKDDLLAFYRQQQRDLPTSEIPAQVIATLQGT